MTDNEPETRPTGGLKTNRMEGFSDGVFSIAITLLVLEIAVPAGSEDNLLKALVDQWPSYLAYLVSFLTIGAIWIKHAVITEYLRSATSVLIRLNLLLLMVVSFLPFPTRLVAEHIDHRSAERVAVTVYGVNLMLALVLIATLWKYATRDHLVRPDTIGKEVTTLNKKLIPGIAGYVPMLLLGLFAPVFAVLGYLALAIYAVSPFIAIRRRRAHR
jgi:uncharacterized membrane protein